MYILSVEETFASAHQLRGYKGKCENIHGHNWKVRLSIKGNKLDKIGLVIDFGEIKKILREIIHYLDHKNLNEIEPFQKINPSSENIAKFICEEVADKLIGKYDEVQIESVTIWESNTSRCAYYPE